MLLNVYYIFLKGESNIVSLSSDPVDWMYFTGYSLRDELLE